MKRFDLAIDLGITSFDPDTVCAEVGQAAPERVRVEDRCPVGVDPPG